MMWIPTPIYERVPQFWLLLGLLFMASGVFLGFEYWLSFVYLGVGMICCAWSVCILIMRARHRGTPAAQPLVNIRPDSGESASGTGDAA
jgi:hypothetical protein